MITVAHLSDPHVGPLPHARTSDLLNKRMLGFLSWKLRRQAIHRDEVLAALVRDLHELAPTHTVVTGDITNIALREEFALAAEWLKSLGPADAVSIVPGNHDAYVAIPWHESLGLWADYMSGDEHAARGARSHDDFPYVRIRGSIAVIGLSTAAPTAPLLATGAVGSEQLERLEMRLRDLGARGLFRIVLIHHHPVTHATSVRKRLTDAEALAGVVERAGAELVLHGHTHRSLVSALESPRGPVPVVGAPSASASRKAGAKYYARYHVYEIEGAGAERRLRIEVRGLEVGGRNGAAGLPRFVSERRFELRVPGQARAAGVSP